jgi:hypothetical protein
MAKYTRSNKVSDQTKEEALKISRSIQRPGQTKEQTKLIAQGIQKGIDLYKKQHKAKQRELNKKQNKEIAKVQQLEEPVSEVKERVIYKQGLLPWILLLVSWVFFGIFALLKH